VQNAEDLRVRCSRGGEIAAERLFDDNAAEAVGLFLNEPGGGELLDDRAEQLAADRKVKDCAAAGLVLSRRLFVDLVQPSIGVGLRQVASEMCDPAGNELPGSGVERLRRRSGSSV